MNLSRSLLIIVLFIKTSLFAQINAGFSVSHTDGCSPMKVQFTNTSTGTSANAVYEWDFGNGNNSQLRDPGSIFTEVKTYSISLTVRDKGQSSVVRHTVTVHDTPLADFSIDVDKACAPALVKFTSLSNPTGGNIAGVYWDFGDGITEAGNGPTQMHTYQFEQEPAISMTVTNEYGCHSTIKKEKLVKVLPALIVDFSADQQVLCKAADPVKFTNSTTGPATLSFDWDFGDGTHSAEKEPSYIFKSKGIYTVKLSATSSIGCTVSKSISDYLNVASYHTDFDLPAAACPNEVVNVISKSTPSLDLSEWYLDNQLNNVGNEFSFQPAGATAQAVKLINTFGTCKDTVEKTVRIKSLPEADGFEWNIMVSCGVPAKVEFKDITPNAVSWEWYFNYQDYSPDANASTKSTEFTYTSEGMKTVLLRVKNAEGCADTTMRTILMSNVYVNLLTVDKSGYFVTDFCDSATVKFSYTTTEELAKMRWDFGDGTFSDELEPSHLYDKHGAYTVTATYTTINGCTGTRYLANPIRIFKKPVLEFEVEGPTTVCGDQYVRFKTTRAENMSWSAFIDGTEYSGDGYMGSASANVFNYRFRTDGWHTVTVYSANDGGCRDTVTKVNLVHVLSPLIHLPPPIYNCDDRGKVTFPQMTQNGQQWVWDFGDGTTSTILTDEATTDHHYSNSEEYKVKLSATNGQCTVADSVYVKVLLNQSPTLSIGQETVCKDGIVDFTFSNYFESLPNYERAFNFDRWEFEDGTPFPGYKEQFFINNPPFSEKVSGFRDGVNKIRAIVHPVGRMCEDTTNYVTILAKGVSPDFTISEPTCVGSPILFKDNSILNEAAISSWEWDFGDGNSASGSLVKEVSHVFDQPGNYFVKLKVIDGSGCSSSPVSRMMNLVGPKADFVISEYDVPLNSLVYFYNHSITWNSGDINYAWDFGDGTSSTEYSLSKTFTTLGTYTITMVIQDRTFGCTTSFSQELKVGDFKYGFTMSKSYINNSSCPPVVASFINTSINFTKILWDFGDGSTLENNDHPSHVYDQPGKYYVTLTVFGHNGLTATYKDSIEVNMPTPSIVASVADICPDQPFQLTSPSSGMSSYTWDFGDGSISSSSNAQGTHNYMVPGSYTPRLLVTDNNGCIAAIPLTNSITVHPYPEIIISPVAPQVCAGSSVELTASGGVSYSWTPAGRLSNPGIANPFASPAITTSYSVEVKDAIGCSSKASVTIQVIQKQEIGINPVPELCEGESIRLQANGTSDYTWIDNTEGLNSLNIPDPLAQPSQTIHYTVVGADQFHCFSDTASVLVTVHPLPTVDAGQGGVREAGVPVQLNPSGSNDIVSWNWTPASFLNCTNCKSPVSTPRGEIIYSVTGITKDGCSATDTIIIKIQCAADRVAIPNAFTPNGDGKNDLFVIKGVSFVKHLEIYNRWGTKIFEKNDFIPSDKASCWNGKMNGLDAPTETYVYFIELECTEGKSFTKKGSFMLIR